MFDAILQGKQAGGDLGVEIGNLGAVLQQIVHDVDPNAFVAIMEVTETLGQGFKELGTR